MNLVIDIGNSFAKTAVFSGSAIQECNIYDNFSLEDLKQVQSRYPKIKNSIISSVSGISKDIQSFLNKNFKRNLTLSYNTPIPIKNLYQSKKTLGIDRIAAAVGANQLFPNKNILVIDAGTAITFDLVNSKNEYLGGNISPGLTMRFKALSHFTKKLPLLKPKESLINFGVDTKSSIISGVENGILFEIKGYINNFNTMYKGLKIILTGGDAFFFDKKLKKTIFVDSKLILKGLNRILEYNDK